MRNAINMLDDLLISAPRKSAIVGMPILVALVTCANAETANDFKKAVREIRDAAAALKNDPRPEAQLLVRAFKFGYVETAHSICPPAKQSDPMQYGQPSELQRATGAIGAGAQSAVDDASRLGLEKFCKESP
jgi:hypothetical protein